MTTASNWRKERGRATEHHVARWFRAHGWDYAQPVGASRQGADITGMPGLAIEVKATKTLTPLAWLRAAASRPGLPLVVARMDGQGPETMDGWIVLMRLDVATRLLHGAGYGDCPAGCEIGEA